MFLLMFGAIVSYISMRLLMWGSYKIDSKDYTKLVQLSYGKNWAVVLYVLYILYTLGSLVSY